MFYFMDVYIRIQDSNIMHFKEGEIFLKLCCIANHKLNGSGWKTLPRESISMGWLSVT